MVGCNNAKRPNRPAPVWQGRPAGISWRSSRHACRTRDHGGRCIRLRFPFTHRPLPAQTAHFTPNEWQEPRHVGGGLAVARVHKQRSCNYHELRWHLGHSALGSFLGMDALLGAATQAMADHSSPDRRARRRADTQRAVYTRAPLQVRRGGRTTSSMSCDTNVSKLLVRWASDTYIRCLLPQLLWCMPLHVMFTLPTTLFPQT